MHLSATLFRFFAMMALAAGFIQLKAGANDRPVGADSAPLSLAKTIDLPMITAGMNHLAADATRHRFFVTVPGARQTVVTDLKTGKVLRTLSGPAAAACFAPDLDLLCVAGGKTVTFYEGGSLASIGQIDLGSGLDELRYNSKEKQLYVGVMDAQAPGIAIIDMLRHKRLRQLSLPTKPQGFAVEEQGPRIYANTPAAGQVTVIDRKKGSIVGQWKLSGSRSNYPVALDEKHHRLFVGCRRAPRLLVFDTNSGNTIAKLETGLDADDMDFDPIGKRIYLACGDGVITTIQQVDADHYRKLADTHTAPGARNALFVPKLRRFYLAVPAHGKNPTELRVYRSGLN